MTTPRGKKGPLSVVVRCDARTMALGFPACSGHLASEYLEELLLLSVITRSKQIQECKALGW